MSVTTKVATFVTRAADLVGKYKKYVVAQSSVVALAATLAADGDLSTSDLVALALAELGALGVRQFANTPAPPARGGDE